MLRGSVESPGSKARGNHTRSDLSVIAVELVRIVGYELHNRISDKGDIRDTQVKRDSWLKLTSDWSNRQSLTKLNMEYRAQEENNLD